jgi:uncharacterized protein
MDVTPLIRQGQQIIQSYAGGSFRVSGQVYPGAVFVTPEQTVSWKAPVGIGELTPADFEAALKGVGGKFDVILLGTGKTMAILPPELRKSLKDNGLNVDSMDTGAACRTYNVLMAEGRAVAAALFPAL